MLKAINKKSSVMKRIIDIIKDYVIPIAAAVLIAFLVNKFLLYKVYVPSASMYPTIKIGDQIVVTKVYDRSKLQRGDVIVFHSKELNEDLIKRLIGLPGDTVVIDNEGKMTINDKEYSEPYVKNKENLAGSFKVPKDSYLFMGDNRAESDDARRWKQPYINGEEIMGKARFIIYPFNRLGGFSTKGN
ncbi:signal peptidase I [Clostridium manihotivorum]|nr:signal peptidase I [Clostridium manihotivorum]